MEIENLIRSVCKIVWSFPLIAAILGVGLYFSFKLNFVQIRFFVQAFRSIIRSKLVDSQHLVGDVSKFSALCTALSATLGTGNIVGIAVAISMGGPGTLFWMIVSSFFSLATKYSEGVLSIKYRTVGSDGTIAGGPMYYIEKGTRSPLLAKLFAIFGVSVALFGIGTLAQTNSIAAAANSFGIPNYFTAIVLGIIVSFVTFGGIHRIADTAEKVVPFMTLLYIGAAIVILTLRINMIPQVVRLILTEAFLPHSIVGGGVGISLTYVIQIGISRGIFCHEAGFGSSAIASAAAKVNVPAEQGLISMMGAFLSIIICTITGIVLLITAEETHIFNPSCALTHMTAQAFGFGLGAFKMGGYVVNFSILFFAFTTIIGWNYYGEKCIQYLLGNKAIAMYKILFIFFVVMGPFWEIKMAFVLADIVTGLMAIPNIIGLISLRKEIFYETRTLFEKSKKLLVR